MTANKSWNYNSKPYRTLLIAGAVLCVFGYASLIVYESVAVEYPYKREVGSHIENAYEVNTPEKMEAELLLALQGMRNLGLDNDMHSSFFSWKRTSANSMEFQYSFINELINRTQDVKVWHSQVRTSDNPESLGDVYEEKMDNLRSFMREKCEGPSDNPCTDWIAHDAYIIAYHPIFSWQVILFVVGGLLTLSVIAKAVVANVPDRAFSYYYNDAVSVRRHAIADIIASCVVLFFLVIWCIPVVLSAVMYGNVF